MGSTRAQGPACPASVRVETEHKTPGRVQKDNGDSDVVGREVKKMLRANECYSHELRDARDASVSHADCGKPGVTMTLLVLFRRREADFYFRSAERMCDSSRAEVWACSRAKAIGAVMVAVVVALSCLA